MRESGTEAHKLYNNYANSPTLLQKKKKNMCKDKVNEIIDPLASHNQTTYLKVQPMPIYTTHIGDRAVYIMCYMQRVEED